MKLISFLTLMFSAYWMFVLFPPNKLIIVIVFTQEDTASAWGVKLAEPIIIFIRFKCMSLYLDGVGTYVLHMCCIYICSCVCLSVCVCMCVCIVCVYVSMCVTVCVTVCVDVCVCPYVCKSVCVLQNLK